MLRYLLALVLVAGLSFWSFNLVKRSEAKSAIERICHTVAENYFDTTKNLSSWLPSCVAGSQSSLRLCQSVDSYCISSALNQSFSQLESSHLFVSVPASSRLYYEHQSDSNGLKLRWVEGKVVVVGVHPDSPAVGEDLEFGDVLISREGEPVRALTQALGPGSFVLERRGQRRTVELSVGAFQVDHVPKLSELSSEVALLRLSSFEGTYKDEDLFAKERVQGLARKLTAYKGVLIDLRGNLGGNFVALLRAISPFLCEPTEVGVLQKLGLQPREVSEFPDSLRFADQWRVIESAEAVLLKSFSDYGCYRGQVALLVDSLTSSVAEIFAHHLRHNRGAKVLGQPTAGAVLVALREELSDLGENFFLNMPILAYLDAQGQPLEGHGVWPDLELRYQLESFRQGEDNWEQEALKLLE